MERSRPGMIPCDKLRDSGIVCEVGRTARTEPTDTPSPSTPNPVSVYQTLDAEKPPPDTTVRMDPCWYESDSSIGGNPNQPDVIRNPGGPRSDTLPPQPNDGYERLQDVNWHNNYPYPLHPNPTNRPNVNVNGQAPCKHDPVVTVPFTQSNVRLYEDISNCPLHGRLLSGYHMNHPPRGHQHNPPLDRLSTYDIASAISESYDLDDDDEALSYISTCISTIPSTRVKPNRRKRSDRSRRSSSSRRRKTRYALSNDQYYPSQCRQAAIKYEQTQSHHNNANGGLSQEKIPNEKSANKKTDTQVYFIDMQKNTGSSSFV